MTTKRMMRRKKALLGAKDKGGVLCTTSMAAIATVLRQTGQGDFVTAVVDADGFNRTMTKLLGERDSLGKLKPEDEQSEKAGVIRADLFEQDGGSVLYNVAESEADILIIDNPAGGLTKFDDLSENLTAIDLIKHFNEQGRDVALFLPFNPDADSIGGLRKALNQFGDSVTYIGARDMLGKTTRDYRLWDRDDFVDQYGTPVSGKTRKAFEQAKGILVDIPVLNTGTMAMAKALRLTFSDAATSRQVGWEAWDRVNMSKWLRAWFEVLDKLRPFLEIDDSIEWKGWSA